MATKTFNAHWQMKTDTAAEWEKSTYVPLKNELIGVIIPAETGSLQTEPTIVFKLGDGTNLVKNLPITSALAGDVYAWAKAAVKPGYNAGEISADKPEGYNSTSVQGLINELAVNIAGLTGGETGSITQQIQQALINYATKEYADNAVKTAKTAVLGGEDYAHTVKEAYELAEGKTTMEAVEGKNYATKEEMNSAINAAKYDDTDLKKKVTTLIGTTEGDETKSARAIAAEEVAKIVDGADSSYDTLKEIADWISGHKSDASAMNSAIKALEDLTAGFEKGSTIKAYVDDAITALKIGDYAKASDLTALAARVKTLEDKGATKTEASETNGNIKIDGKEVTVYTHPEKHAIADVDGLQNALAAKANDSDLAAVAKSGKLTDLVQDEADTIIFNCGDATHVL